MTLDIDLKSGVVPVSDAAASLTRLIKRAQETGGPVIITQKGYPTGVLISIETYEQLRALTAAQATDGEV